MSELSSNDIALEIKNVDKEFKLPHERKNSLKEWVLHFKKPTYERMVALSNINLAVRKGEFFGIVGRNGSGKSTLLKIIGGIYQPTKGRVTVNGTLTPFIELGIGFNAELTGRENVYLNGAILGLTRKEIAELYDEIVAFAELERFMDQKLKNYSSGMQVRLAFSIAIQAHNDILLIDEVLAVGDAAFQRKCFKVFNDIKKSGKTVIFVTHDMDAVQQYCDRAMMIEDSKVIKIGKPREVALKYEVANSKQAIEEASKSARPADPGVKLQDITIKNSPKNRLGFNQQEDIQIDVEFTATRLEPVQFNVFLTKQDGVYLAGKNTAVDLRNYVPKLGKNTITFNIDKGQLSKGRYNVCSAVYTFCDWPTDEVPDLIDILDPTYGFTAPELIVEQQAPNNNGEFNLKGTFTSKSNNK